MADPLKIGLIAGREWSFPPAFVEEVNRRDEGVVAEFVRVGAPRLDDVVDYAVIVDRVSHEIPFYRTFLKHAAVQGVVVVNDPFLASTGDSFLGSSAASRLGIATPKTVALPPHELVRGGVREESLRNLVYPLDWRAITEHVGLPCVLRDGHGAGSKEAYVCHSTEELIYRFDQSEPPSMIVQELIEWDRFVRCIVLGGEAVAPIEYDPMERRPRGEGEPPGAELGERIAADSLRLVRSLGCDVSSVDWAVKGGIAHAIDVASPAPDLDLHSLTPRHFEWAVRAMADLAIRLAREPRPPERQPRWRRSLTGRGGEGEAGGRLTGQSDLDGAGDLAEEMPSLARDLPRSDV